MSSGHNIGIQHDLCSGVVGTEYAYAMQHSSDSYNIKRFRKLIAKFAEVKQRYLEPKRYLILCNKNCYLSCNFQKNTLTLEHCPNCSINFSKG